MWYLRVEAEEIDSVSVLTVAGRVSSLTSPQLGAALARAVGSGARAIVLDLSGVDYLSSAGLRALLHASDRLAESGRRFIVCALQDPVSVAFGLAGMNGALAVEPSRELALEKARRW